VPVPADILQRVVFIGDAGAPAVEGEPVLESLRDTTRNVADRTVVVFLGDNIYPAGLPPAGSPDRGEAEAALAAQLAAAGKARAIFVPGNHDWANAKADGLAAVLRQAEWVDTVATAEFSPRAGCPGPVIHDLRGVRLVTLDTQWWLHQHQRGRGCPNPDTTAVIAALREALAPTDGRPVVVAAHHPLRSRGHHGGFYSLGDWIFPSFFAEGRWRWLLVPAPGIGPLVRRIARSDQDFGSTGNGIMRNQLTNALRVQPPLVYASGHEHTLQILDGGGIASLLVVSGAGSSVKATPVGSDESTLFAHQSTGYMILDILPDRALLRVVEPRHEAVVYWRTIPLDAGS